MKDDTKKDVAPSIQAAFTCAMMLSRYDIAGVIEGIEKGETEGAWTPDDVEALKASLKLYRFGKRMRKRIEAVMKSAGNIECKPAEVEETAKYMGPTCPVCDDHCLEWLCNSTPCDGSTLRQLAKVGGRTKGTDALHDATRPEPCIAPEYNEGEEP